MDSKNLAPEQQGEVVVHKTVSELLELIEAEGVELTDEQLEKLSGGWDIGSTTVYYTQKCANCKNVNKWYEDQVEPQYCQFCGAKLLKLP